MTRGHDLHLEGDANDYVGKGLSGGKDHRVSRQSNPTFAAEDNVIIGQRRALRRDRRRGLHPRRGGRALLRAQLRRHRGGRGRRRPRLRVHDRRPRRDASGKTGRNFGAGMSGGVAFVLDESGDFARRVNLQMVGIEQGRVRQGIAELRGAIEKHHTYTRSETAGRILREWDAFLPKFVKVMPKDYQRMLACIDRAQAQGLTGDEAIMAAFEENARDTSRVGGN
jgi:glutamate synthase domain-containing protein 3